MHLSRSEGKGHPSKWAKNAHKIRGDNESLPMPEVIAAGDKINKAHFHNPVQVIHRKRFRAEYSGRKLAECLAKSLSVEILSFGEETNIR